VDLSNLFELFTVVDNIVRNYLKGFHQRANELSGV